MTSFDKLRQLGVSFGANGDEAVDTTVMVESIDQLKWLLDIGLDDKGRAEHFAVLFAATGGGGEGFADELVRNIAAYAVGDEALSDDAREAIAPAFPLTIGGDRRSATDHRGREEGSQPHRRHAEPRALHRRDDEAGWLLLLRGHQSDLHLRHVHPGRLDRRDGSDFQIVGLTAARPRRSRTTPGQAGRAGSGGPGECSSGRDRRATAVGDGTTGDRGTKGTDGTDGDNGTGSQAATIWIKKALTAPQLVFYTQSGPGAKGGDGGDGGLGQPGGNGGNGVSCGCTGNAGGSGKAGGPGRQGRQGRRRRERHGRAGQHHRVRADRRRHRQGAEDPGRRAARRCRHPGHRRRRRRRRHGRLGREAQRRWLRRRQGRPGRPRRRRPAGDVHGQGRGGDPQACIPDPGPGPALCALRASNRDFESRRRHANQHQLARGVSTLRTGASRPQPDLPAAAVRQVVGLPVHDVELTGRPRPRWTPARSR